jgi:predicted nucleic acid-binding protein
VTVVETTVWVDALQGRSNAHTDWLNRHLTDSRVALTDLILCEVLQGIRRDDLFTSVQHELLRFEIFKTGGADLALASAVNYRTLRMQGITIRSTIDCLIATFCIREGHSLLHCDRDYDAFEKHLGLSVIHP